MHGELRDSPPVTKVSKIIPEVQVQVQNIPEMHIGFSSSSSETTVLVVPDILPLYWTLVADRSNAVWMRSRVHHTGTVYRTGGSSRRPTQGDVGQRLSSGVVAPIKPGKDDGAQADKVCPRPVYGGSPRSPKALPHKVAQAIGVVLHTPGNGNADGQTSGRESRNWEVPHPTQVSHLMEHLQMRPLRYSQQECLEERPSSCQGKHYGSPQHFWQLSRTW